MVWVNVGVITASEDWELVGNIDSNTLRLSYSFSSAIPPKPIFGQLRERYEPNLFNSRWYKLYPKVEKEVLVMDRTFDFEDTLYSRRGVQIRMVTQGYTWTLQIEQWL